MIPRLFTAVLFSLPALLPAEDPSGAAVWAGIPRSLQTFVDHGDIAGAVTLVIHEDRAIVQTVGLADLESRRPMREDALFAIASMTKPTTTTAVLKLQSEGKLSVLDPVAKYLPAFANVTVKEGDSTRPPKRPLTILDLMTHTAGLAQPPRRQASDGDPKPWPTLEETTAYLAQQPLAFEPGSKWQYSSGMTVCGRLIEVVSGQSYDAYLDEQLFRPLGMTDTTFYPDASQRLRLATLYKPSGKGEDPSVPLVATPHIYLGSSPGIKLPPNPSGGLFTTAHDLGRFYRMILRGGELDGVRILPEAAVRQMTTVQSGEVVTGFTPGNGWGLGWCVVRQPQGVSAMLSPGTFGHGGAWGTQAWLDPRRKAAFVLLIQRLGLPNSDGSDMRAAFQQAAVKALPVP